MSWVLTLTVALLPSLAAGQGTASAQAWSGQGFFVSPSSPQPFTQNRPREAKLSLPRLYRLGFAVERQQSIVALVPVLFKSGRPSTVTRLVSTVVVDAIKRESRRAPPHVSKEGGKTVCPPWAHRDASMNVITHALSVFSLATALRISPRAVFSRGSAALVFTVNNGHD